MMMFKSSLAVLSLSAALQLVLASSVTITTPEPNAVWEAGSTVQIKWKVNNETTGPIRLQYASGPSKALKINGLIADHVNASLGKYSWKIPTSIKGKKYVIEAGPSAKDLSFAGYISIKNDKKTTTKKHTTKKHTTKKTKKHTTKKHSSTRKHNSSTKKTKKHHTTTKKTSKKTTAKAKKTHTKKTTTTKKGGKPSAVCVGYPARGEGVNQTEEYVRCHSLPKGDAAKAQNNKKHTTKKTKKHTTKKHTTKKHSTKKHTTTKQ